MIKFEEALDIARKEDPNVNHCEEYKTYYVFWNDLPQKEMKKILNSNESEKIIEKKMNALTKKYPNFMNEGIGPLKVSKKDGSWSNSSLPVEKMFPTEKLIREFEIK